MENEEYCFTDHRGIMGIKRRVYPKINKEVSKFASRRRGTFKVYEKTKIEKDRLWHSHRICLFGEKRIQLLIL